MQPNEVVELTENYTVTPNRAPRVTLRQGQQFTFKRLIGETGWASVEDGNGTAWQIPSHLLERTRKPVRK